MLFYLFSPALPFLFLSISFFFFCSLSISPFLSLFLYIHSHIDGFFFFLPLSIYLSASSHFLFLYLFLQRLHPRLQHRYLLQVLLTELLEASKAIPFITLPSGSTEDLSGNGGRGGGEDLGPGCGRNAALDNVTWAFLRDS